MRAAVMWATCIWSEPSATVGGCSRLAVARIATSGTRTLPWRRRLRARHSPTDAGNQTATAAAPRARAAATRGRRSSGAGLVLSTTTERPAASASSISRSCRRCRCRALGQASLLMWSWVAAKQHR